MTADPGRPYLLSKTMVPHIRSNVVDRPRLLEMLDRGDSVLTTVVAPAGWGKTTLLAQWAKRHEPGRTLGWLTLDHSDDDPVTFWEYFIRSLQSAGSEVGDSALTALAVPGVDPRDVAIPRLVNDLVEVGTPHTVILDDFHTVERQSIAEEVEYLLTYLPPNARVVLGARFDPPFPLALWRARGLLTEIRAQQLRFDIDEATHLMREVASVDLDADASRQLVARTEGWVAGLQLTALVAREANDSASLLDTLGGDHSFVHNYVLTEVVTSLTEEQRDFILRCSVLDRLSAALCDFALDIDRSADLLDQLERDDPFLTRLGSEWFQYHSLVREALSRQLVQTRRHESREVLRRAAEWYLENGDPDDAIRHVIGAGDTARAVELLLHYEDDFLDRGRIGVFLSLADSLGPEAIHIDPRIGVAMAWADGTGDSGDRVVDLLDRTEAIMTGDEKPPVGWSTLSGAASALRAIQGHQATTETGMLSAVRAVKLEQDPTLPGYAVARLALGLALSGRGPVEEAIPHFSEAWEKSHVPGMPAFARLPMAGLLAGALVSAGQLDDGARILEAAGPEAHRVEVALGEASAPAVAALRVASGHLALVKGDVEGARDRLAAATTLARIGGNPWLRVRSLALLAEAELAAGHPEPARLAVDEAREITDRHPVFPATMEALGEIETLLGRSAVKAARTDRRLFEDLTDRELSILRALAGPLTQREIGRELHLSINTVKGYTKGLYRKLRVASRAEAVQQAKLLGLI
jgi:LuxR family transcriptional regulator, maltose regulon positive regulatory protein